MSGYGNGFGYPDPYGLDPEDIEVVIDEGLERLYEFYKDHSTGDRPNIRALLVMLLSRIQAFEDAVGDIVANLTLADAEGWWLDNLWGKLVDLRRRVGWSDDSYRFYIETKLLALRSSGTADDLLAVARRMTSSSPALVRFRPEYGTNRGYRMEIPDVPTSLRGLAVELMSIATMGGVRGMLVFYDSAETAVATPSGILIAPSMASLEDLIGGGSGTADGTTYDSTTYARTLDGDTDRLDFDSPADVFDAPHTITIEMRADPQYTGRLLGLQRAAGNGNAVFVDVDTSGRVRYVKGYQTTAMAHRADIDACDGEWHSLAIANDGGADAGDSPIYFDGVEVAAYTEDQDGVGLPEDTDGLWSIGGREPSDGTNFAGEVRGFRVYDSVLTPAQIYAIAKGQTPLNEAQVDPAAVRFGSSRRAFGRARFAHCVPIVGTI